MSAPTSHPRGCALVPAYQEERHIADVVRRIRLYLPDVVVVDDGSTDATAEEAARAGAVVLRHAVNRGKGVALETGFNYAREHGFEFVITLDADGQHDPAEIPRFLEAYTRTGLPVLVGNRMGAAGRMPFIRRLTNWYMSWLLSRKMGQRVPDTQCGYRLYRCAVLPREPMTAARFAAESEILLELSARRVPIGAVPITTIYGDERSKIRPLRDTVRFLRMLWRHAHRA